MNGTEPLFRGLPEPEIADMERVLEEIDIILPVLGLMSFVRLDMSRPIWRLKHFKLRHSG